MAIGSASPQWSPGGQPLHQTVVKGIEENYRRIDGVSGATILADGRVALILDAQRIIERAGGVEVRKP